jgi:trimeric autotransporter adhesin
MKSRPRSIVPLVLFLCLALVTAAGQENALAAPNVVPGLINYSGVLKDATGRPLTGVTGVTFLLYAAEQGGIPLWLETQNVMPEKSGRYSVQLGATSKNGIPPDLFMNGEARWLAVQIFNEPEQPRVLLVAVPYAMKALDAQTIGGLPPSAFVLAAPPTANSAPPAAANSTSTSAPDAVPPPAAANVTTTGGTANKIPMFTTATNIQNSILTQSGTTVVNVGGTLRLPAVGTATAAKGFNSQPQQFLASVFSSSTTKPVVQSFQWQAEPFGNDTANPAGTLNLLYAAGTAVPAETGLKIGSNGQFTFAPGQKFPGTSTITNVKAGTDLTGGGTTGVVTLNLDSTKVPQLATVNTFTANQTVNGTMTAASFSGNGANVTNVNAVRLGGLGASAFAQLAANNTFTGQQDIQNLVFIGAFSSFLNGELNSGSTTIDLSGIGAQGFSSALGSGGSGSDGIQAFGGSGDPTTQSGNTGGRGIYAEGGTGDTGGVGVYGRGLGGLQVDGAGGFFEGGNNSFFAGDGIDAVGGSGYAGNFSGNLNVTGAVFAGTKDFRVDHPLDPANKYLTHASVESSEMMNIYTGNVITDAQGDATVSLPDWFEAENTDFRYQLTVVGQFAQAIVASEIANHRFQIKSSVPNVKVSWLVTGVRQDAYAKAHPLIVEQEKEARLRGFYIHPELHGAPPEKQLEWARHPELMKRIKDHRNGNSAVRPAAQRHDVQASK